MIGGVLVGALVLCALAATSRAAPAPAAVTQPARVTAGAEPRAATTTASARGPAELLGDTGELLMLLIKTAALLGAMALLGLLVVRIYGPRAAVAGAGGGGAIRILAVQRLEARTTLYLLEVAGSPLLVAVSDREVRALTRTQLDAQAVREAVATERRGARGGFRALLGRRGEAAAARSGSAGGGDDAQPLA
ncbi:MAG: hypothetical protein D6776_07575 [Planctomycetota bacterium]|nr:MAG: hypothetical protein D6776_07575 [Planctomycetota bacterium]